MRDGISRPELDGTVKALTHGKTFEEAAKEHLHGVDPKVIEANRESIIKLAATELGEMLVTPERAELSKKLHAQLKPATPVKGKQKPPHEDLKDIE